MKTLVVFSSFVIFFLACLFGTSSSVAQTLGSPSSRPSDKRPDLTPDFRKVNTPPSKPPVVGRPSNLRAPTKEIPTFESTTVGRKEKEDAFRSPRATTILDRKRLEEKRPRSTPEALQEEAGVFVQKTNHGGGAPIIRGTVGPQLLIVVDGVRLNASTFRSGPNQSLNLIDPWSIYRLEVLRGPGSVAFGSYAFGGVISIETESPLLSVDREWMYGGRLSGRYGSSDHEGTGHLDLYGSAYGVGIRAGVTYGAFGDLSLGGPVSSRNFGGLQASKNDFGDIAISPDTGRQMFSAYQNLYADTKLLWRLAPGWFLEAAYQRGQIFDAGRADQLLERGNLRYYNNIRDLGYLRLRGKIEPLRTEFRLTASFHYQQETDYQQRLDIKKNFALTRETRNSDQVGTLGVSLEARTQATPWLRLSYGVDVHHDVVDSQAEQRTPGATYKASTANYPSGSTYSDLGIYAMARFRLWEWAKGAGFYLDVGDRFSGFFAAAPARDPIGEIAFQQFGNALYGSLQFLIHRHFNVSLTYAEGFRAPNLQEAIFVGDSGNNFEIPNADLRPEISRTLEATIRFGWEDVITGWANGYYSFWNDLITKANADYLGQTTIEGKPVAKRVNASAARMIGVEGGLRWKILGGWSLAGQVTYSYGGIFGENGVEDPLSRIPPLFFTVSTRYDFKNRGFLEFFVIGADAQRRISQADREDPRIPDDGTPGWLTLNFRGGFRFNRYVQMSLLVENLLNSVYKYHGSGVYGPGLSARATLELRF